MKFWIGLALLCPCVLLFEVSPAASQVVAVETDLPGSRHGTAEAEIALKEKRFGAAIEILNHTLAQTPDDPVALRHRGFAYLKTGDRALSLRDLERSIALKGDDAFTHHILGEASSAAGDKAKAYAAYSRAIELKPGHWASLHNRSVILLERGDLDAALADIEKSIAAAAPGPPLAVSITVRGSIFTRKGQYDRALVDYDHALKLFPGYDRALKLREAALAARGGTSATAVAQPASVGSPASIDALPSAADPRLQKAMTLYRQRKYDESSRELDLLIAQQPGNVLALQLRSAVQLQMRRPSYALADLNAAVKVAPRDAGVRMLRGNLLTRASQFDRALADFDEVLSIQGGSSAPAYAGRGLVYRMKGDLDRAIAEYDRAIAADARFAAAYAGRGRVFLAQKRIDKALIEFDRALAQDTRSADAHAGRGLALLAKGRAAEANVDFERALEINPGDVTALFGRGLSFFASGQPERAIGALDDAIERGFQSAEIFTVRGRTLLAKGDTDPAIADFDRALKIKPASADALVGRAGAWFRKKDYAKALADVSKAMSLDHSDLESYLIRAGIYEAQGKSDLAVADLRKAEQFAPRTAFEALALADVKKKIDRLTKATPCPGVGDGGTCL